MTTRNRNIALGGLPTPPGRPYYDVWTSWALLAEDIKVGRFPALDDLAAALRRCNGIDLNDARIVLAHIADRLEGRKLQQKTSNKNTRPIRKAHKVMMEIHVIAEQLKKNLRNDLSLKSIIAAYAVEKKIKYPAAEKRYERALKVIQPTKR